MDAGTKNLADILSGNHFLEVPRYQRSYEQSIIESLHSTKRIANRKNRKYDKIFLGLLPFDQ